MRYRIEEYRGPTYGMVKPFRVQERHPWWERHLSDWEWSNCYFPFYPFEAAQFDTLEGARAWIKQEKARLKELNKEAKSIQPIYHRP